MDYFFLYGHEEYIHNIIVGVKYDGKDYTDEMNDALYGGPYDIEFTIFQAVDKHLNFIFRYIHNSGYKWDSDIE